MPDNTLFVKYKLHHLLFWLLAGAVWYYLRYQDYSTSQRALVVTVIKITDLALLIYMTNYLLIPRLLYKGKYLLFTACFLLMIVASSFFKMWLIGHYLHNPALYTFTDGRLKERIYDNVIPHFFLVTAGAAGRLIMDYMLMQQRMAVIAKEKAETELAFLKSQINPHFLFNSLNAVYFLIDKNNTAARQSLHKFSDMLRYQLYEVNDKRIRIEKEISYLRDYIDLQRLRKEENYIVRFHSTPEVQGFSIESLLLIPFVENAFKHVSAFSDKPNFITVDLSMQQNHFMFRVVNSTETVKTAHPYSGIGLQNVRRRLELLYPGKHELVIRNETEQYTVELTLEMEPEV